MLPHVPRAEEVSDHHLTGRNADADPERSITYRRKFVHFFSEGKARSNRSFRVMLVRLRVTKIYQDGVADGRRDKAAELR
ncbi:MAG: hypothetical protein NVSMB64_23650 [Candidatus Velthaea sp.]